MSHLSRGGHDKIETCYGISMQEKLILHLLHLQGEEEEDLQIQIMMFPLLEQQLVMIPKTFAFMNTAFGALEPWTTYADTVMPKPLGMNLKVFVAKKEKLRMYQEFQHHLKNF